MRVTYLRLFWQLFLPGLIGLGEFCLRPSATSHSPILQQNIKQKRKHLGTHFFTCFQQYRKKSQATRFLFVCVHNIKTNDHRSDSPALAVDEVGQFSLSHQKCSLQPSYSCYSYTICCLFFLVLRLSKSNNLGRPFASWCWTRSAKYSCFRASNGRILFMVSQVKMEEIKSSSWVLGAYLLSILDQSLALSLGNSKLAFYWEQTASCSGAGVPKILMISMSCSMELSPGKTGSSVSSYTMMHPADHMSISQPQVEEFRMSSGARQDLEQIQETLFSLTQMILAEPKSQILAQKVSVLMRMFGGFRSRWQTLLSSVRKCFTYRQARPLMIWKAMSLRWAGLKVFLALRWSRMRFWRLVLMKSMRMKRVHCPSITFMKQSFISTMLGWSSCEIMLSSRFLYFGSWTTSLRAYCSCVRLLTTRQTLPKVPWPISLIFSYWCSCVDGIILRRGALRAGASASEACSSASNIILEKKWKNRQNQPYLLRWANYRSNWIG